MTADLEAWPPPNDPTAFESLCLDLWKEIWGPESGAQKNGRSGQAQAGVDLFGRQNGAWIGVQCKQKDGLLRSKLTVGELDREVGAALGFDPKLGVFILATSGPRDATIQARAREITEDHAPRNLFRVEVWSWQEIWPAIHERKALLQRIGPTYWPSLHGGSPQRIAPSRLTHVAEELIGREIELARLDAAWADPRVHVLTLVAWGGVGKTSLVAKWAADLAGRNHDGADFFDWSFYSQGTGDNRIASSDTFLAEALRFFGDPALAASAASPWDKGARLAQLVAQRRTLLILDGLEPLQHPPSSPLAGQLKDPGLTALLKGLAARNPGLCLVTTRETVTDLAAYRSSTTPEWALDGLATPAGARLLETLGVHGIKGELERLVADVKGHALTLNLLGTFLRDAHRGDVRKRDLVRFDEADDEIQGGHAFRVMQAYERWLAPQDTFPGRWFGLLSRKPRPERQAGLVQLAILRLLGLFDRPASGDCLAALRRPPAIPGLTQPLIGISDTQWNLALSRLAASNLVAQPMATSSVHSGGGPSDVSTLDAHPLVREYFAHRLREKEPKAWRAAHNRLFEHLRGTTEHQPDTLAGLQPLYQAVAHGCQAGRQQEACDEVYVQRILRGTRADGFYSVWKLGALGADLGAVACFFERPWSRVSPALTEDTQAWCLNQAAFHLRALGRLTEALEPLRVGLEMRLGQMDWRQASKNAGNLSELELTLGEVPAAVRDAEQSVTLADQTGDDSLRSARRATQADALHQAGRRAEALELFREAERVQAERKGVFPLLHSLGGFRYCDLLLAEVERAASSGLAMPAERDAVLESAQEVERRATTTLAWAEANNVALISAALDHLTLGRAKLYRSILEAARPTSAKAAIERAVDGLRRAGVMDCVVRGLLSRAWLRHVEGDPAGAQADLAEAQEIAERGPMPLHLADLHLYRARLFRDREALAKARALIEKHGYWRRKEELEDAEEEAKRG